MKQLVLIAAVAFLGYTFIQPVRSPDTPVVVEGPVAVALRSASSTDRENMSALYNALADVTERDAGPNQIPNTGAWRRCHSSALRLAVGGTPLPGQYPGLDTAVEQVLAQYFSLDNAPLTPELRAKIVAACREVARQSGG